MNGPRSGHLLPASLRPISPYVPALLILLLQPLVLPTGIGSWSLGVITGLLTALVALGLALIYRANRIINFAQGDLGTVPTTLAVGVIAVSGLPYLVGVLVGLAAAVVLGVVIEVFIIRRFFRAPRLLLTVATIGLSQLLIVCGLWLPRLWHKTIFTDQTIPQPFTASVTIGTQVFGGSELLALIVAPSMLVALALFLHGTDIGVGIRASAERADRAALLGIPVRRLQTLVWVIASVLSFTGVFLYAGIFGFPSAATLSPQALAFALAALVIGRMDRLPAIALASIAVRVLEQGVLTKYPSSPGRVYFVLAGVVLLALVFRRAGTRRVDTEATSTWSSSEEVRPVPAELRTLPVVRLVRIGLPILFVALAAGLPLILSPSNELKASTVAAFSLVALSLVVLTGWAGQVSLGQMSFTAVGGVVGALATAEWGLDLSLALLLAGCAGALVTVVVGLPALRLPGFYLAVTTFVFALAAQNYLFNRKEQAWIPRDRLERPVLFNTFDLTSQAAMYEFVLVVVVLGFIAMAGVRRSRTGRVLVALRDNERGVAAYAVPVLRVKLTAFAISGFLAAVAGALLVHINQAYTEQPFLVAESLGIFTAAVVGGLGSLPGAVLGALYLNGGIWFLPDRWRLLPSAVGVLAVLLVLPGGLGSLLFRLRDAWLRRLARRRGIVVASLMADEAGDEAPDAIKVAISPPGPAVRAGGGAP